MPERPAPRTASPKPAATTRSATAGQLPSLWPKEHGAYAMVGFALLTALMLATPSTAALALGLAITAAFLMHEPLLVLLGARGRRPMQQLGRRARRRLVLLGMVAVVALAWALGRAPAARLAMLLPLLPMALLVPLLITHREKSLAGELLVALAAAAVVLPVARASAVPIAAAWAAAAAWTAVYAVSTLAVRVALARAKKQRGVIRWLAPLGCAAVLGASGWLAPASAYASLAPAPAALVTLVLSLRPPGAHRLRAVGWTLVGCDLFALAALLLTLR